MIYRIVDDEGSPVGPMTPGNLQVKGPNVLKDTGENPSKPPLRFQRTATSIRETSQRRGAVMNIGREKDLIISGGLNVCPMKSRRSLIVIRG